jgi:hypothetical protein
VIAGGESKKSGVRDLFLIFSLVVIDRDLSNSKDSLDSASLVGASFNSQFDISPEMPLPFESASNLTTSFGLGVI